MTKTVGEIENSRYANFLVYVKMVNHFKACRNSLSEKTSLLLAYELYSGVMLPFNGTTNTTPDERKSDRINQRSLVDCISRLCLNVVEVEIGGKKFEHCVLSLSIEK